jgi:hypothetical protein
MVNTLTRIESCIAECSFIIPVDNSKGISPEDIAQTVYIDLATGRPIRVVHLLQKVKYSGNGLV